jgi:hypothetical protein
MDPTVAEVMNSARAHLDDLHVSTGEVFTDAVLTPFFEAAYGELFAKLVKITASDIVKTAHYNLPAYTSYLSPVQIGISDLDEPIMMWERGKLKVVTVTAASAESPVVITAADHPFANLEEVILSQVGPEVNGRWFVNYIGASSFSLRGSASAVAYSNITGKATSSTDRFIEMVPTDNLSQADPGGMLREYEWENGVFRFIGATEDRQLQLEYKANGAAPTSGKIGLPGCKNFLAARTASLAVVPHGNLILAAHLNELCFGVPSKGVSGFLDDVIRPAVLSMQSKVWRPGPFRPRRVRNYNY